MKYVFLNNFLELLQSSSTDLDPPKINDSETVIFNIKVESGKLLYDKRWYV